MMTSLNLTPQNYLSVIAIALSLTALFFTVRNYLRKEGIGIRGGFSINSSVECHDDFVGMVTLENIKDRSITIFSIYLRVGYNYYIKLSDYEESPLILKAYETLNIAYGPITGYTVSSTRVDINNLLKNKKIKKRIVLSTSTGKYVVPRFIKRWNPILEMFKNDSVAVLHPNTLMYKDEWVGENIKFVVDLIYSSKENKVLKIRPNDYEIKIFKNFNLTKQCLENKNSLEEYLNHQKSIGNITFNDLIIFEVSEHRSNPLNIQDNEPYIATKVSFFEYKILGPISSKLKDRQLKKENKKNRI
ncbi:hypothetical protein [Klebsiella quasipneumoniae]|uniref:hypothetical protein n=1 Tax=Klebsiella quasipneumoniae TaxID=1463165 RepID=UPI001083488F|nr:hypothetical protein [Klebsiella quasipneumoniae]UAD18246.1 hypothetical protein K7176_22355 [Klebsiella quasipneumoniae]HCI6877822.1 hypothetical protein [Klebsiella quasipneumoniae subsp. similipneumoniae]